MKKKNKGDDKVKQNEPIAVLESESWLASLGISAGYLFTFIPWLHTTNLVQLSS
jgi:hypothetical protein